MRDRDQKWPSRCQTTGKQRLFTRKLRPRLYHFLPNLTLAGLRVQTGNYLELLIVFIVLSESL